ncbi:uncharacterized protein LOC105438478 [Strongylocentrotus purpuratus]|uniref:Death domain-containing protein n=1 Tax=Strongylocentrotus purpuratus TaxID=7668 RepID=A0A7M7HD46_STRPU|nr:uncharacterized protein LOC105438478 [Strongylocentrotus purpuratus]|eukprot:XP_011664626.1 PREDICTED: uncharacterized protein LOC105438478 [Strongylocentrotus purpuratus]
MYQHTEKLTSLPVRNKNWAFATSRNGFSAIPEIKKHLVVSTTKMSANIPVSEVQLQRLATEFPHDKYGPLCLKLGGTSNQAQNRLVKLNNDYPKAVMEVLIAWKNRTGGYMTVLTNALNEIEAAGLIPLLHVK